MNTHCKRLNERRRINVINLIHFKMNPVLRPNVPRKCYKLSLLGQEFYFNFEDLLIEILVILLSLYSCPTLSPTGL